MSWEEGDVGTIFFVSCDLRESVGGPATLAILYKDTLRDECEKLALDCLITDVSYYRSDVFDCNSVLSLQ